MACRRGLKQFPDDGELLLEEGLLCRDMRDLYGAEASWLQLLQTRKGNYFASEDVGLRGFKTRQFVSEIYAHQSRWLEVEVQSRAALIERSDSEPAWMSLAELYLRNARWHELHSLLDELAMTGVSEAKLNWLRARGHMQRQEYASARRILEKSVETDATATGPLLLLSQALIHEGKDWVAAEKTLQAVLKLHPANQEARHNLQVLERNRMID